MTRRTDHGHPRLLLVAIAIASLVAMAGPGVAAAGDGAYIVVLKDSAATSTRDTRAHVKRHGLSATQVYGHALRGYAARLNDAQLRSLRDDPSVAMVVSNGIATIDDTQTDATWGIDRSSAQAAVEWDVHVHEHGRRRDRLRHRYGHTDQPRGVRWSRAVGLGLRRQRRGCQRLPRTRDTCRRDHRRRDLRRRQGSRPCGGARAGLRRSPVVVIAGIDFVTADHQAGEPAVANMSLGGGANIAVDLAVTTRSPTASPMPSRPATRMPRLASSARRGCRRP